MVTSMAFRCVLRRARTSCRTAQVVQVVGKIMAQRGTRATLLPQFPCRLSSSSRTPKDLLSALDQPQEEEKDVRVGSFEVERDLGAALREVQEMYKRGQYSEALDMSLSMKDWASRGLGEDHPVVASIMSNIGLMHKMQNEFEDAVRWYREALHTYKRVVGEQHRSYAAAIHNLGLVFLAQAQAASTKLQAQNYLASAEETLRKALEIRSALFQVDDAALMSTRSNLASVLQRTGRVAEAEDMLRSSLAVLKEKLGDESEATAVALTNLAYLLKEAGRKEEALQYYAEALDIRKKLFPPYHAQVIISLNNMEQLYVAMGDENSASALRDQIMAAVKEREALVAEKDQS